MSAVFDIDQFVVDCRTALAEHHPPLAVKEVVERALSRPDRLDAALGVPERGALSPLHRSESLTVLWVVWPPRVSLFPHDHRMWAVNGIYGGTEDNIFYRRRAERIVTSGGRQVGAGEVVVLGSEAIHSVANPHPGYTAAIHVYGGDYFGTPRSRWDPKTLIESPFDAEQVRRALAEADEEAKRFSESRRRP